MYNAAPINNIYNPTLTIESGMAEISQKVESKFFHAANALHGSVYFKLLDDASFFAANSLVSDVFVLTTNFNIKLLRPVSQGALSAKATVSSHSIKLIITEASLFSDTGKLIATGVGTFMRSKIPLTSEIGYK